MPKQDWSRSHELCDRFGPGWAPMRPAERIRGQAAASYWWGKPVRVWGLSIGWIFGSTSDGIQLIPNKIATMRDTQLIYWLSNCNMFPTFSDNNPCSTLAIANTIAILSCTVARWFPMGPGFANQPNLRDLRVMGPTQPILLLCARSFCKAFAAWVEWVDHWRCVKHRQWGLNELWSFILMVNDGE